MTKAIKSAPTPTVTFIMLTPKASVPSLVSEITGRSDSKDMTRAQWKITSAKTRTSTGWR